MQNDQLIVVCGIPASGKTTLIKKLEEDKDRKLFQLLNINYNLTYNYYHAFELKNHPELQTGNLIIHYDIVDRFDNKKFEYLNEYIVRYENPLFINLIVNREALISRYKYRYKIKLLKYIGCLISRFRSRIVFLKNFPNGYWGIPRTVDDNDLIFQKWIKELKNLNVQNIIFLNSSDYEYKIINS